MIGCSLRHRPGPLRKPFNPCEESQYDPSFLKYIPIKFILSAMYAGAYGLWCGGQSSALIGMGSFFVARCLNTPPRNVLKPIIWLVSFLQTHHYFEAYKGRTYLPTNLKVILVGIDIGIVSAFF